MLLVSYDTIVNVEKNTTNYKEIVHKLIVKNRHISIMVVLDTSGMIHEVKLSYHITVNSETPMRD